MDGGSTNWIAIGLSSGLVAGLVTFGLNQAKDAIDRRRVAQPVGYLIAEYLEDFALSIPAKIDELHAMMEEAEEQHSSQPLSKMALPEIKFPQDIAWERVDVAVAAKARGIVGLRDGMQRQLLIYFEHNDLVDLFHPLYTDTVRLGIEAFDLAVETRRRLKIPQRHLPANDLAAISMLRLKLSTIKINDERQAKGLPPLTPPFPTLD